MSAWDAETNDGWSHEQTFSCDKCDTDKEFKGVLKIDIQEKNVGWFAGKDCSKIKNYVIDKTFTEVGGDTELFCEVVTKEGEVFARIKAQDAKGLEALRENVLRHEEIFKEKEKQTRLRFRTRLDHDKIGKMIGSRGSNIDLLRNQIRRDCSLFHDHVYVKVEKYNIKEKTYMSIGDFSDEEETVLITVDLFTEHMDETEEAISLIMFSEVKELMEKKASITLEVDDPWNF
tara:strand:- start:197 stop:889 length:693 start_codon:yes stop_codon:yes gene_type:complete